MRRALLAVTPPPHTIQHIVSVLHQGSLVLTTESWQSIDEPGSDRWRGPERVRHHALSTGALTLDQVAAAAEFATPDTDAELARVAVGKPPSAIGLAARTLAPPVVEDDQALYARRALSMTWTRGRRELAFSGRLPLEQGAVFEQAIWDIAKHQRARRQAGRQRPRVAAVGRRRARHARPTRRRREGGVRRSATTLIVHLSDDAPPLLEGAGPLSPETAERLTCDARRLTIKPSGRDLVHSRVGRCASYAQHARAAQALRPLPVPRLHRHARARSAPPRRGRGRRQDRARQPDPALPPTPQTPPRPPHPHQRHRRRTRLHRRSRTRDHHQPTTRTTPLTAGAELRPSAPSHPWRSRRLTTPRRPHPRRTAPGARAA